MNCLRAALLLIFLLLSVLSVSAVKKIPRKNLRKLGRVQHERIQPAGGYIGFVKTKYYKN